MALGARAGGRLLGARAAVSWSCCLLAARVPEWQEAKHLQPSQPATYSQPCLTGCTARLRCSDFELESTTNRAEGDIGGARSLPASHGMLPCRCLAGCGLMQSWCCRHAKLMLHATTGSGSAPLVAGLHQGCFQQPKPLRPITCTLLPTLVCGCSQHSGAEQQRGNHRVLGHHNRPGLWAGHHRWTQRACLRRSLLAPYGQGVTMRFCAGSMRVGSDDAPLTFCCSSLPHLPPPQCWRTPRHICRAGRCAVGGAAAACFCVVCAA